MALSWVMKEGVAYYHILRKKDGPQLFLRERGRSQMTMQASIRIGLTEEGLENYKSINVYFFYIDLMKKTQRPKYIFDQLKSIASLEKFLAIKERVCGEQLT